MRPTSNKSVVKKKKQQQSLILDEDATRTWIKQSNSITNMMADYNVMQLRILAIIVEAMQEAIDGSINHRCNQQLELFQNEITQYGKLQIVVPMVNFGVKHNHYAELRLALEEFSKIPVQFKVNDPVAGKNATKYTHLLDVTIPEKYQKSVVFNIDKDVAERFLNVQGGFTKFLKEVVFALDSPYNVKFYYMCCSWLAKGGWSMKMEDLRQWLCVGDKYQDFKDFNRRVLKPTQAELEENANCYFQYTPVYPDGSKQPSRIDFKVFRRTYTAEEQKYLDNNKSYLRELMLRHFEISNKEFDEKIDQLLTLYNVEKATEKFTELYLYIDQHKDSIANKKEYLLQAMFNYLDPHSESNGQSKD